MNEIGIDDNFYSRQIGTYGFDTIKNLMKMKVLIYGLRGLGMEIAKNIILIGPKCVSLYDKNIISHFDLGSGFYFSEEQINKFQRDEGCLEKLSQLNSYVEVNVLKKDLISSIQNYNIIVITELISNKLLNEINEICRANNIGLIYGAVLGLLTFTFVDFGENFIIQNENGKSPKKYFIKNISNSNICKIIYEPESIETNPLKNGDTIILKEIKGMSELNNSIKKIQIKPNGPNNELYIEEDTTKYNNYIRDGILEEIKIPIKKKFLKFNECLIQPKHKEKLIDDEKDQIRHSILYGIIKYYNENNSLPELNDELSSKKIMEYSKNYFEERKKCGDDWFNETSEDFDEAIALDLAKWSRAEIIPICSFMGGIMAQEIVKYTGKFSPIEQWIWFDFYDSIKGLKVNDRKLKNSRYDEQISIYGNDLQNKLANSNIFMIGSGALGCEYLKIFSMLGISTSKNSKVIITDNDNIEISNLNRQFLFRKNHTGLNKAVCAYEEIKKMNKNFNCEAQMNIVSEETEYIYTEEFYKRQNFIINAVDNNKARNYIDSQCTLFNKILIDSGTEGLKAHNQLIIPKVTDHGKFGDSNNTIPMCTLRQFPSTINHCIEWGKDKFDEYFIEDINFIKEFILDSSKYLKNILNEDEKVKSEGLCKIQYLLSIIRDKKIDDIINNCIKLINDNFILNIQKIIDTYPENYRNEKGILFWSGCKRFPRTIKISQENHLIKEFIESYTKIFCHIFKISFNDFEINKKITELIQNYDKFQLKKYSIDEINISIKKIDYKKLNIVPEIFEKDNDSNNHIKFIYACSNLRAENYNINICDKLKVKFVAGKIIPAVTTTSACITGFSTMQMINLLHNNKRDNLKELTLDLGLNIFKISKPYPIQTDLVKGRKKLVCFPNNFSVWDHIEINGPLKINDFILDIKNKFGIKILGIYIYKRNISLIENIDSLGKTFEENYCKILKINPEHLRKTIAFEIDGKDINKNNVIMPTFIYKIKND